MSSTVYTIGHSNHSRDRFVQLLAEAKIDVLVDIRSNPRSSWASYANPPELRQALGTAGIRYIYLGDALGGRPKDRRCYNRQTGEPDYDAMQKGELFQRGVRQLLEDLEGHRTCLMCAEEDPSFCHRNLLVGESMRREGVQVLHIRGTGQIQTDEDLWKDRMGVVANQLSLPIQG